MAEQLIQYTVGMTCPKCGHADMELEWIPTVDLLAVECERCAWATRIYPLDAVFDSEPEAPGNPVDENRSIGKIKKDAGL